ncbi:MAG: hypothetical protein MSC30_06030 [Gaiellaceae bacterium MAG52_C11]|nr:hypothetical protein [Candidatus Gaiellasilicea maunaloa]
MHSLDAYLRFFAAPLELLCERGHDVRLLLEEADHSPVEQAWLDRMLERPNFRCEIRNHFAAARFNDVARSVRQSLDYLRYLGPEYEDRAIFRRRSARRSPEAIKRIASWPLVRSRPGLAFTRIALSTLDRAMPPSAAAKDYVDDIAPDVLAVCDYGRLGSLYSTYVKAARETGVSCALCVASWDNLSTRQLIRELPDSLIVWNERQRQEALEIHGVPSERVVITGAQCFDQWFTWQPRSRTEFCERVGLDPDKPYILWVGSALVRGNRVEPEFVRDWITRLRESDDDALSELGVLLRSHPKRLSQWLDLDPSDLGNVSLWPRESMTMPTDIAQQADYFDSIFHSAAVVGINSSAMIEAAVVGRPVFGLAMPEFHDSHRATFHFSYVLESEGGIVRVAESIEDQLAQIRQTLTAPDPGFRSRNDRFVESFIRPAGLELPATPIFVQALEALGERDTAPSLDPPSIRAFRRLLPGAIVVVQAMLRLKRGFATHKRGLLRKRGRYLKRAKRLARTGARSIKRTRRLVRKRSLRGGQHSVGSATRDSRISSSPGDE